MKFTPSRTLPQTQHYELKFMCEVPGTLQLLSLPRTIRLDTATPFSGLRQNGLCPLCLPARSTVSEREPVTWKNDHTPGPHFKAYASILTNFSQTHDKKISKSLTYYFDWNILFHYHDFFPPRSSHHHPPAI